jgi:hypothetical protein
MSKSTDKKSFLLHKDSLVILDEMTDAEAGVFLKAIYAYQKTGELPSIDRYTKLAITPFINQFMRDQVDWEDKKLKASQAGIASGNARQRNERTLTDVNGCQRNERASTDSTVSVSVSANVNDNVSVSNKENPGGVTFPDWVLAIDGLKDKIIEFMEWRKKVNKKLSTSQKAYNFVFNDLDKMRTCEIHVFDLVKSIDFAMIKKGWVNLELQYFINLLGIK